MRVYADGGEDAAGDGVEEGFGQFPIIAGEDVVRVDGFHAGPDQFVMQAVGQQAMNFAHNLVGNGFIEEEALFGIGATAVPILLLKSVRCAFGDGLKVGAVSFECLVDGCCSQVG